MKLSKALISIATLCAVSCFTYPLMSSKQSAPVMADEDPTPLETTQMIVQQKSMSDSGSGQSFTFDFSTKYTARANKFYQVYMIVDDENFIESDQKKHSGKESDPIPPFSSFIAFADVGSAKKSADHDDKTMFVIPEYINHNDYYLFDINKLTEELLSEEEQYEKLFAIYVPSTVLTAEKDSFVNVPDSVTVYCEDSVKKAEWDDEWTDATNVVWGAEVIDLKDEFKACYSLVWAQDATDETITENILTNVFRRKTYGSGMDIPTGENYSVGYYNTVSYDTLVYDEETSTWSAEKQRVTRSFDYKLKVSFDVKKADGSVEKRHQFEEVKNTLTGYDAIGMFTGKVDELMDIDIPLAKGETVVTHSFVFSNIYNIARAKIYSYNENHEVVCSQDGPFIPYIEDGEFSIVPRLYVNTMYELKDFLTYSPKEIVTFNDYTQVSFNAVATPEEAYKKYDINTYNDNIAAINSGKMYVRLRLRYLTKTFIKVECGNKNYSLKLDPPDAFDYLIIGKSNNNDLSVSFRNGDLGPDFDPSKISKVELTDITVSVEIIDVATAGIGNRHIDVRFGSFDMYDLTTCNPMNNVSLNLVCLISTIIYLVLFVAATFGLYFFKKNKYKNDEFKRMNTKKYFIASIKYFIGVTITYFAILFLVFRIAFFNTRIVLYNPIDPWLCGFSVLAIVFIGLGIKNLVVYIKQTSDAKKKKKLKLDQDVVDDGTK